MSFTTKKYPDYKPDNNRKSKKTATTNNNEPHPYMRYVRLLWGMYIAGIVGAMLLFYGIANGLLGELPSFLDLENPKTSLASEVYASDSTLLGKFFMVDRSNATREELPDSLINALLATEDIRFYEHSGVDWRALLRALGRFGKDGGGSTVSQQLAKNLFHDPARSLFARIQQKLKEWVIAVKLERSYTKDEILTMYLNIVPFGYNAKGVKAASRVFFSKQLENLRTEEGAVLIGMLQAPTRFNPLRNPERSKKRRNIVLSQMTKYGYLAPAAADSIKPIDIALQFQKASQNTGAATYFREYVRQDVKKWAKNTLKVDGSAYDVHRDGLKIYTTINRKMQQYAEEAVVEHMQELQEKFYKRWGKSLPWESSAGDYNPRKVTKKQNELWEGTNVVIYNAVRQSERYRVLKSKKKDAETIKKDFETPTKMTLFAWEGDIDTTLSPIDSIVYYKKILRASFMALDPATGHVLAWVGGINYKHFKYDNVSHAKQAGSIFKPFVYTLAMENGWSPCLKIPNVPVTFERYDNWTPGNSSSSRNGQMVSLEDGLALSINWITARLMKEITPEPVVEIVRKMGVKSDVPPLPSICLGTPEVSLLEMVGAYSTFANKGFYSKPITYTEIRDKNGNEIQVFPTAQKEAMSDKTAYAMVHLLKGVTNKGTASSMRGRHGVYAEIAGKTGTTNDNSDGWYIGMAPKVVAGAWVGGDEKAIRFRSTKDGSGAAMALPIVAKFLKKVYADPSLKISADDYFDRPAGMTIELDCNKYAPPIDALFGDATGVPVTPTTTNPDGTPAPPVTNPDGTPAAVPVAPAAKDYNDEFDD